MSVTKKGLGVSPLGVYALGMPYISYSEFDKRNMVDYYDNSLKSTRYINQDTKDYELTPGGNFKGMDPIQQMVQLAFTTELNSSSVKNFGHLFSNIKVITPGIKTDIINYVNSALGNLINTNKISLQDVKVTVNGTKIITKVTWIDLAKNTPNTTTIGGV